MQNRSTLLFVTAALLIFVGWMELKRVLYPLPKRVDPPPAVTEGDKDKPKNGDKPPERADLPPAAPPTPAAELVALGSTDRESSYHIGALFDPRGASVRQVVLNKFDGADGMGRPIEVDGQRQPLVLVPDTSRQGLYSNVMYHFDVDEPTSRVDRRPLETLGNAAWKQVAQTREADEESVSFEAPVVQGVTVTKKYTVRKGEYHIGLEVRIKRGPGSGLAKDDTVKFAYQMTGSHGLPVEGKWYTATFRNSLIGQEENGYLSRDFQDLRQISHWVGGQKVQVRKDSGRILRYAGTGVQYFASVIVVDDEQKQQDFLAEARPTLEVAVAKGRVKNIANDVSRFTLETAVEGDLSFALPSDPGLRAEVEEELMTPRPGNRAAVIYTAVAGAGGGLRYVALGVREEAKTQSLWEEDITVRVTTEPIDLKPDQEVVHKYLLYNGPVKPSLLSQGTGGQVARSLIDRYAYTLHLNTMTDYQSPGWIGSFSSSIGWTRLLIWFTNIMHTVLGWIHAVIPNHGLDIILLTVIVRVLMFPVSRKQTMMSHRMQQMMPELKKMQEKYKDDRQQLAQEQMALYRKHGVNPLGTCWLLLLQLPIFMGLYYALMESISFRLADFWPTWIINLAAPDMLWNWGQGVPWISRPEDFGSMFYLGPFLNLMPIVAVTLMFIQMKLMSPPPTDDQMAAQQQMMQFMMIFMGLMFYKVAAGLCLYFIATTLWGLAERRLLPKMKPAVDGPISADAKLKEMLKPSAPVEQQRPTSARQKRRANERSRRDEAAREEAPPTGVFGKLRAWWRSRRKKMKDWATEVLKQAEKK